MKHSLVRTLFTLALLSLMPLALAACGTEDGSEDAQQPLVTDMPPPVTPPVVENVPIIDDPMHEIWRPGYWAFENRTFTWVPGKIISRPSPTAVWVGANWQQHNFGWSFQQGHWQ